MVVPIIGSSRNPDPAHQSGKAQLSRRPPWLSRGAMPKMRWRGSEGCLPLQFLSAPGSAPYGLWRCSASAKAKRPRSRSRRRQGRSAASLRAVLRHLEGCRLPHPHLPAGQSRILETQVTCTTSGHWGACIRRKPMKSTSGLPSIRQKGTQLRGQSQSSPPTARLI